LNPEGSVFEVESRYRFDNVDEAYQALPFLRTTLEHRSIWSTAIYGLTLFRAGRLLRTAKVEVDEKTRHFIGWKGPDTGKFANIRQELDEEISAVTTGNRVLRFIGGRPDLDNFDDVVRELERLGHPPFMSFEGIDLSGYYQEEPPTLLFDAIFTR
jgi:hypothetical protein